MLRSSTVLRGDEKSQADELNQHLSQEIGKRDKAIEEVTSELFPLSDCLILTAPDFPRALRPEAIAAVTEHPHSIITYNVAEAIDLAKTAPRDAAVFFTGSLFLVGEARKLLLSSYAPIS